MNVAECSGSWARLEQLLQQAESEGLGSMSLERAREFGRLYRSVSSDLIRARSQMADITVTDYLNDIVARSYTVIHARRGHDLSAVWHFLRTGFPRLFRKEWRMVALAAALLVSGAGVGAGAIAWDLAALGPLISMGHQDQTPDERVARERAQGGASAADQAAIFSAFLFTHNIKVSFMVFALGITFGLGTVAVLFYNGALLGALGMQYHQAGQGLFFWAWVLPHGIPELTVVCIAGAAGMLVARGLWMPGRLRRRDALIGEAKQAARLVMGGMPLLVFAGLIEGTISQLHEPLIPSWAKLTFALAAGTGVYAYLLLGGRRRFGKALRAG